MECFACFRWGVQENAHLSFILIDSLPMAARLPMDPSHYARQALGPWIQCIAKAERHV